MDRLTEWTSSGHAAVVNHHENYIDRLAAYEDTGLEPEEVKDVYSRFCEARDIAVVLGQEYADHVDELLEAEKQGRLIVLPCKVGDTVYVLQNYYTGKKKVKTEVAEGQIDRFIIGEAEIPVATICTDDGGWYESMEPKDYYLTREEAEAALGGSGAEVPLDGGGDGDG